MRTKKGKCRVYKARSINKKDPGPGLCHEKKRCISLCLRNTNTLACPARNGLENMFSDFHLTLWTRFGGSPDDKWPSDEKANRGMWTQSSARSVQVVFVPRLFKASRRRIAFKTAREYRGRAIVTKDRNIQKGKYISRSRENAKEKEKDSHWQVSDPKKGDVDRKELNSLIISKTVLMVIDTNGVVCRKGEKKRGGE